MIMIIREKSINFVFNKSKYRQDSRKIDSKCTKKCSKTSNFLAHIGTAGKYFKILERFCAEQMS